MAGQQTAGQTCPHHGAVWPAGNKYKCGCAIDKWTLARLKKAAESATARPHSGYTVEGEDDGYHD